MNGQHRPQDFAANYRRALKNSQLQLAMANATAKFKTAQKESAAERGEHWELMRERARAIKEHTINNLDYYLEEFAANVEWGGGRVFWARDAAEANLYISNLARERGVRLAVKGKSMMTEEIDLNRALAAAGVEAVETDLGEYIVQLAGERPSHINMPAVHKTRGDVADLFSDKLKVERTEDIDRMTALARRLLRARFAEAGMGVTGVNFAVAETEAIVLVENEGNIRMTISLPRVHVAVMGLEKVIPSLQHLEVFLPLLTGSASGQKMCSYVSVKGGVRRSAGDEASDEFHVVILDNGRVEMLANEHLRESLYCIRCGACLNVCPVYQKVGGHAYGWVYPGPIGAVLTPQLIGRRQAPDLPFASSLCGACRDACPLKINIPDMLMHLRHEIKEVPHPEAQEVGPHARASREQGGNLSGVSRLGGLRGRYRLSARALARRVGVVGERAAFKLWAVAFGDARRYRLAARLLRLAQRVFGRKGPSGARTLSLRPWTGTRDLPPFASRSFREQWPEVIGDDQRG